MLVEYVRLVQELESISSMGEVGSQVDGIFLRRARLIIFNLDQDQALI